MACDCEFKKAMRCLEKVRELARKTAILTDEDQVIFRKEDGTFAFVPDGHHFDGELVEYVLS